VNININKRRKLRKKKGKKKGRRGENVEVLNIQVLAMKSLLHSSSYLEREEGKKHHEKM